MDNIHITTRSRDYWLRVDAPEGQISSGKISSSQSQTMQNNTSARLDSKIRWLCPSMKITTVIDLLRMLCAFGITYCSVNIWVMTSTVIPKGPASVEVFYRYGLTLPASVLTTINCIFLIIIATLIRRISVHFSACQNFSVQK